MERELLAGRFMPLRRLGSGGMAEVVLARDTALGEDVALKIIHPHLARDPSLLQRFRTEIQVSRAVRHPGIIEAREFYEGEDGRCFISMEYLPGGDLKRRIVSEGVLPIKEVERIAVECLEALSAAHAKGVVHRDLKPQNILFDGRGRARIADFGIARLAAGSFVPDSALAIGTPDYCPPEIMRGEGSDGRSDIYSLGATLFEALTGQPPFLSNSPYRSMKLRATQDAPRASTLRPEIPARLDDAIARALERESSKRFQTARAFLEALRAPPIDAALSAESEAGSVPTELCVCPDCGATVPRSLSWCFACGRSLSPLVAAPGRDGYDLVVTGPGKPGDKLDVDHREICLRLASGGESDPSRLRKRIPRLPFVLARGLTRSCAQDSVKALERSGIQAVSLGRESRPADRRIARAASFKRVAAVTPRIWLIMLASSGSFANSIGKLLVHVPGLAAAAVAALILVPPAIVALSSGGSFTKLPRRKGSEADPPLRGAAALLGAPELRQLARSIAEKRDALDDGVRDYAKADETDRKELIAGIELATATAAADLVRAQELFGRLGGEAAPDPGFDPPMARELERELDETKGRILGCAAAFDALSIRLSGLSLADGRKALAELESDLRGQADIDAGLDEAGEALK